MNFHEDGQSTHGLSILGEGQISIGSHTEFGMETLLGANIPRRELSTAEKSAFAKKW